MSTSCHGLITAYVDCLRQTECYKVRCAGWLVTLGMLCSGLLLSRRCCCCPDLQQNHCLCCARSERRRSLSVQRNCRRPATPSDTPCLPANAGRWTLAAGSRATRATSSSGSCCCCCSTAADTVHGGSWAAAAAAAAADTPFIEPGPLWSRVRACCVAAAPPPLPAIVACIPLPW